MGKRTKVPAALHSELAEYASLLRALRTSDTLDLTSQLAAPPKAATSTVEHDAHPVLDDDGESERPLTETAATSQDIAPDQPELDAPMLRRLKRIAAAKIKKAPRDDWTRWPLLAGDVHVPEWSLEDEVRLLAAQALRGGAAPTPGPSGRTEEPSEDAASASGCPVATSRQPSPAVPDQDEEEDLDVLLPPIALSTLTASSGRFLAQLLAVLAAYVPPGGGSMQNRLRPINWESVLDIAATNGLVDEPILSTVRTRLTAIYSPSADTVPHTFIPDHTLRDSSPNDLDFLTIDGYDPQSLIPKRKRGPYRKRSASAHERSAKRLKSESASPEG